MDARSHEPMHVLVADDEAPARQRVIDLLAKDAQIASVTEAGRKLGLTHNLGGMPGECVSFVSVVGSEPSA